MIVIFTTFDKDKLEEWKKALLRINADFYSGICPNTLKFILEFQEQDGIKAKTYGVPEQHSDDELPDDEGMFNSPQFLPKAGDDGLPF